MPLRRPKFEHDCSNCAFIDTITLQRNQIADVYVCPQLGNPTVIVRLSSDGPDYQSHSIMTWQDGTRLRVARALAEAVLPPVVR